ncbi:MAG: exosortase/archaeosortase family protein [Verrucomicrobiae bacterium]|nr:exosortase/archaeosortase family protein [Verrucomicrobiae bacterium]
MRHLPIALVLGWWVLDLQVHWRALVEFQHGWLVVPLAAYLAWERWPTRPASEPPASAWGPLLLALFSMPLVLVAELHKHAVASTAASSFALSLGCTGFLLALIWLQHGAPMARRFAFPILFLFVAVPIPRLLWNPVVLGLQGFITVLNVEALNLLGIPAFRTGNVIQLPQGAVGVDEACSGIRSLQASIMAALFIADLTFRRGGAKVLFLVVGVALAVVGNFGRSLYLSITAARRGVDAIDVVHDAAGWSVLMFTAAGLAALAWLILRAERRLAEA